MHAAQLRCRGCGAAGLVLGGCGVVREWKGFLGGEWETRAVFLRIDDTSPMEMRYSKR